MFICRAGCQKSFKALIGDHDRIGQKFCEHRSSGFRVCLTQFVDPCFDVVAGRLIQLLDRLGNPLMSIDRRRRGKRTAHGVGHDGCLRKKLLQQVASGRGIGTAQLIDAGLLRVLGQGIHLGEKVLNLSLRIGRRRNR